MKALLSLALGFSFLAGSAAWINTRHNQPTPSSDVQSQATNGAYRDGLYQGRQSAERAFTDQAPVGRWSSQADRAAFAAGYEEGYRTMATTARNVWSLH